MTRRSTVIDVHPTQVDFRHLVEESLAGIYLVQGNHFLYVNTTMAELFGYSADEIVHERTVEDLVVPEDRERVRENIRQRSTGEIETIRYTFRGLRRDGSTFHVEVRGRRIITSGGPAILGTLLDVSEREQERDRLRFLARAAELLESSLDYEATLESLARLTIPFFADLCVIDVREGAYVRRLSAGLDGDAPRTIPACEPPGDSRRSGESADMEPGSRRGELLTASAARARLAACFFPEDIAELDRVRSMIIVPLVARGSRLGTMMLTATAPNRTYDQADLEFAQEIARCAALSVDNARLYHEAQIAIQRRDDILAVVSHDLRNPLNVILMGTTMGLEQDRRQQGPLEIVHNAAKQMEALIQDLLDISAIEAGGFSVAPRPHPIGPLVAQCLAVLGPTASRRAIRLDNHVGDDQTLAFVDESRAIQALNNLIGNAIKFTPDGGRVRLSLLRRPESLILAVTDSGPGIPHDQLEHVFDRFWKGHPAETGGAGLGLSIVRGIAEAHGGSVRVESEPGEGSTFYLELPTAS